MNKTFKIIAFILCGLFLPNISYAQYKDFGIMGSFALTKAINKKWDAKLEQELRTNTNTSRYDRSKTTFGLDYTIIKKTLKVEGDYNFIHQRQKEYFEFRNRASFSLTGSKDFNQFSFDLRSRLQSTWRDENRGDYKYNPKLVWRNMLECSYAIFGSPFKPYVSAELFYPINSAHGFYMDGVRATLGAKYRTTQRSTLDFYLRYNQDVQQESPQSMLYAGFGWRYRL